jgi:hypothetical protein
MLKVLKERSKPWMNSYFSKSMETLLLPAPSWAALEALSLSSGAEEVGSEPALACKQ